MESNKSYFNPIRNLTATEQASLDRRERAATIKQAEEDARNFAKYITVFFYDKTKGYIVFFLKRLVEILTEQYKDYLRM